MMPEPEAYGAICTFKLVLTEGEKDKFASLNKAVPRLSQRLTKYFFIT
jgi:hypothetical protein